MCVHSATSLLSCVQLFVTPRTVAHKAPLPMGFFRQEYWNKLPCLPPVDLEKVYNKDSRARNVARSLLSPPPPPTNILRNGEAYFDIHLFKMLINHPLSSQHCFGHWGYSNGQDRQGSFCPRT